MVNEVQEFCLRWNNHHNVLVSVLDSLLARETLVDVVLAAEGRSIKVHRLVLCACSQYFEDLLSQQCDKQAVVFLKDVRFVDLKALVDYMYRGEVNVSQDQLAAFLSTAESLRIKGLADKDDNYRVPGQLASSNKPVSARKRRRNSTSRMTNEQLPSSQGSVSKASSPKSPPDPRRRSESPVMLEATSPTPGPDEDEVASVQEDSRVTADIVDCEEEHFVAIEPKLEDEEAGLTVEHLEAGDDWSARETEEEWSNSEAPSAASPTDHTNISSFGQEVWSGDNTAGTSAGQKSKTKPSNSLATRVLVNASAASVASSSARLPCPKCERTYSTRTNLNRHLRNECDVAPPHLCPLCPYRGAYKSNLRRHLESVHQQHRPSAPSATVYSSPYAQPHGR